jgi:nucleotide-binding universal stress UspA family protein
MFSSVVVPLDLEPHGDRALPIASRLAATAGIPLELVTVSSPAVTEEVDRFELERRGRAADAPWTATILHDNDPAAAIVGFVAQRSGALVVMATRARSAIGELVLGSVSEGLLGHADGPFLLIGPNASPEVSPDGLTPVAGSEDGMTPDAVGSALAAWSSSFDGPPPRLADLGHGGRAATALMELADRVDNAMIVVASARWTDPDRTHLRSVARRLAHHAHHPVLVVPAERVPASAP